MGKISITSKVLFLLFGVLFLVSCSLFDEQLKVIKKAEDIANNWDDVKFSEIYENPSAFDEINSYKKNAFDFFRDVCQGEIIFKIANKTMVNEDKSNARIYIYCDGHVNFEKLYYKDIAGSDGDKHQLIHIGQFALVRKHNRWLIEDFDY